MSHVVLVHLVQPCANLLEVVDWSVTMEHNNLKPPQYVSGNSFHLFGVATCRLSNILEGEVATCFHLEFATAWVDIPLAKPEPISYRCGTP